MSAKNTENEMTQREWDRIVGFGKVPAKKATDGMGIAAEQVREDLHVLREVAKKRSNDKN